MDSGYPSIPDQYVPPAPLVKAPPVPFRDHSAASSSGQQQQYLPPPPHPTHKAPPPPPTRDPRLPMPSETPESTQLKPRTCKVERCSDGTQGEVLLCLKHLEEAWNEMLVLNPDYDQTQRLFLPHDINPFVFEDGMPDYIHASSKMAELQTLNKRMKMNVITYGSGRTKTVVFQEIIDLYKVRLNWLRSYGQTEGFYLRQGVRHRRGH